MMNKDTRKKLDDALSEALVPRRLKVEVPMATTPNNAGNSELSTNLDTWKKGLPDGKITIEFIPDADSYYVAFEEAFELNNTRTLINLLNQKKEIPSAFLPLIAEIIKDHNSSLKKTRGSPVRVAKRKKREIYQEVSKQITANDNLSHAQAYRIVSHQLNNQVSPKEVGRIWAEINSEFEAVNGNTHIRKPRSKSKKN